MVRLSTRTIAVRGAVAALVATVANVVIVLVAGAAGIAPGFRPLSLPPVAFLTLVGVVGATVVFRVLAGRSASPERTFRRVAAAVLLISLVPDLGLLVGDPAATPAGVVVLMLMHVVAAAAAVWVLTRGLEAGA
jgi:hypothetical protein